MTTIKRRPKRGAVVILARRAQAAEAEVARSFRISMLYATAQADLVPFLRRDRSEDGSALRIAEKTDLIEH